MATPEVDVGETLRRIRRSHSLSLRQVAGRADISVATLSRVETNKQSVDVEMLRILAGIFGVAVSEILGERLRPRNVSPPPAFRRDSKSLEATMDELLAIIDRLRDELLNVQRAVSRRRKR